MTSGGYWLMKTEPEVYSIDNLRRDKVTPWDGVRNYQARNFMRDQMRLGDLVLFYHSNAKPAGIVGTARITREGYPDETQWDFQSIYFDPRGKKENPVWYRVDVGFVSCFKQILSLPFLREQKNLQSMLLLKKGMRLSVQPVTKREYEIILRLASKL